MDDIIKAIVFIFGAVVAAGSAIVLTVKLAQVVGL